MCEMQAVAIVYCVLLPLSLMILLSATAHEFLPPPPPISCINASCTVKGYQGAWPAGKPCKAAMALFPTSEAELLQAVALAAKTGSKVKVVSKGCHSFNKLICPGGENGILISTQNYNSYIHVNVASQTVTADAGVILTELLQTIAHYGLALPHTPFYGGVSVGGMISTGAHGSGMWGKGCAPHDYVVGIRLIVAASAEEGYAKAVDIGAGDEDLDAARLSLGVLGAISRVTFQLEPMFKRSVTVETREDERLELEILDFAQRHEFGYAVWYPAQRKVLYSAEDRVPVETPGNGAHISSLLSEWEVSKLELKFKNWASIEEKHETKELCSQAKKAIESRQQFGNSLVNNVGGIFTGYPVVGFNNNLQTSKECDGKGLDFFSTRVSPTSIISTSPTMKQEDEYEDLLENFIMPLDSKVFTCHWNPLFNPLFIFDVSISISISHIKEAILDIKRLRDSYPSSMCKLEFVGGLILRFLAPSTAYLGERGKSIVLEAFHHTPRATPQMPMLYMDAIAEIEQMLLFKFQGKPHWGKNRIFAFQNMHLHTPNIAKFLEARKRFDSFDIFSSEWSDVVLGVESLFTSLYQGFSFQNFHDHCAIEGLCICTSDSHCNPSKHYFCRTGHIFEEARVCRYENPYFKDA